MRWITVSNISVISKWSTYLLGKSKKNNWLGASIWKTFSRKVVSITHHHRCQWNSHLYCVCKSKSNYHTIKAIVDVMSRYGSWIYNYLCNQCLSPLMLWVRISIRARCTTLCDKVCQWLATGRWFSLGPPVSSTNKI
jgi:hypothetical protein